MLNKNQWVSYESCWHLVDGAVEPELVASLKDIATRLLGAFEGEGYCRFDIRQDRHNPKKLHV